MYFFKKKLEDIDVVITEILVGLALQITTEKNTRLEFARSGMKLGQLSGHSFFRIYSVVAESQWHTSMRMISHLEMLLLSFGSAFGSEAI